MKTKHRIAPYFRINRQTTARIAKLGWVHWNAAGNSSLSPIQVCVAYKYPKTTKAVTATKIGIGSLGGAVSLPDIQVACARYGIPTPNVQVITTGGATASPDPGGADVENILDVLLVAAAWSYRTGTPADIVVCIGPNTGHGIADVTTALVAAGCKVVNWSWGAPEAGWNPNDRAYTEASFAAAVAVGVTIIAASGDNSLDDGTNSPTADYPCGSAYVWAVGGTRLLLNADGSIASESAWGDGNPGDPGGGGGFDTNTPQPSWQNGIVPSGKGKGVPDSCAPGDPVTGYQIVTGGQWAVVGGTSGASPITAGFIAVEKGLGASFGSMGGLLYPARATAFNDIVLGSDGAAATVGWDEATGLGSPNGPGLTASLQGTVVVNPPPPPPPVTSGPTQSQMVGAINALRTYPDQYGRAYLKKYDVLAAVLRQYALHGGPHTANEVVQTDPPGPPGYTTEYGN